MHAVVVHFRAHPAHAADLHAALRVQARTSLEREAACRRFDVLVDPADAEAFLLYELYDDAEAFRAHLETEHFQAFNAKTQPWVAEKSVAIYTLTEA